MTKEYQGISYLSYEDMEKLYPKGPLLGSGATGTVYSSGEYVIKVFNKDITFSGIAIEIDIYVSNNHPCIMKPVAWSYNLTPHLTSYLVMPKGQDIIKAYKDSKITMAQIIFDTLSAVDYLHSKGITHHDIKPGNMVYHNDGKGGKCKLIDMGTARKGELSNGEYYTTEALFTPAYVDPEYYQHQYNNAKCDIYSLAASFVDIETGKVDHALLYSYENSYPKIDWFVQQAILFWDKRPSVHELLLQAQKKYNRNNYIITSPPQVKLISLCGEKYFRKVIGYILDLAYEGNHSAQALFIALNLVHRTYKDVIPILEDKELNIKFYSYVILHFANLVTNGSDYLIQWLTKLFPKLVATYSHILVIVLISCKGIISTSTYWDRATNVDDLLSLLNDTTLCDYDAKLIRKISTVVKNKCVNVKAFISEKDLKVLGADSSQRGKEKITNSIGTCALDLKSSPELIEKLWTIPKGGNITTPPYELFGVVIHNRHSLKLVNKITAVLIFLILRTAGQKGAYLLDKWCSFDWRNRWYEVREYKIHPFCYSDGNPIMNREEQKVNIKPYSEEKLDKLTITMMETHIRNTTKISLPKEYKKIESLIKQMPANITNQKIKTLLSQKSKQAFGKLSLIKENTKESLLPSKQGIKILSPKKLQQKESSPLRISSNKKAPSPKQKEEDSSSSPKRKVVESSPQKVISTKKKASPPKGKVGKKQIESSSSSPPKKVISTKKKASSSKRKVGKKQVESSSSSSLPKKVISNKNKAPTPKGKVGKKQVESSPKKVISNKKKASSSKRKVGKKQVESSSSSSPPKKVISNEKSSNKKTSPKRKEESSSSSSPPKKVISTKKKTSPKRKEESSSSSSPKRKEESSSSSSPKRKIKAFTPKNKK